MKKRAAFLLFLALCFLITFLVWKRGPQHAKYEHSDTPTRQVMTKSLTNAQGRLNIATNPSIPGMVSIAQQRLTDETAPKVGGANEWLTPIEFYGRVIDDHGQPVQGAQVKFACNDLTVEGTSYYAKVSDDQGMFAITGVRGKVLSAKVSKEGYYTSQRDNNSFTYAGENSNFVPDRNHPIVFHLRKYGQGEPLIGFSKNFKVPKDGTPIFIDLLTHEIVASTETGIKVECRTEKPEKRGAKFDWQCRVTVPGGGLQPNTDEFGFLAPGDGYAESDEIDMMRSTTNRWQSDVTRHYFIQTGNGLYGRLTFRMLAGGENFCRIESVLNPSGSRNLEPDRTVQPKQTQFE